MKTISLREVNVAQYPSMNGRYYRTSMDDIKNSEGWFKKLLLLGLINFIPIFGQMTVYGYSVEWAHKAAWGVQSPMPSKIYSRPGSKMLRWGWFVIVISIVCAIIPAVIQSIGSAMTGGGAAFSASSMYYDYAPVVSGPAMFIGSLVGLVAFVLSLAAGLFALVGSMRMTVYDSLGAGLQFGKIWKMMKHDFGGLMRIFGMSIIIGLIIGVIAGILIGIVVTGAAAFGIMGAGAAGYSGMESPEIAMLVFGVVMAAMPIMLVLCYVLNVMSVFANVIIYRAMGYWTRQFNVAQWGRKEDPMPFEAMQAAAQQPYNAAPQQPQQPYYTAPQQPQQPSAAAPVAGAAAAASAPAQPGAAESHTYRPAPEQAQYAADAADVAADTAAQETPPDLSGDAPTIVDPEFKPIPQPVSEEAPAADVAAEEAPAAAKWTAPAIVTPGVATMGEAANVEDTAAGNVPEAVENELVSEPEAAAVEGAAQNAEEASMSEEVKKEETQYASAGDVVKQNIGTGGAAHESVHGGMAINVDEEKKKKASNPPAPPGRK